MTRHDGIFTFLDWITDPPRGGRLQMWLVGAGLASLTLAYGVSCVITQNVTVPRVRVRGMGGMHDGMFTEIDGNAAVTYGIIAVVVSLFMHFQWFWGNHPRLSRYYEIGKYGTLLLLLVTALAIAYTSLMPLW
jgi:hypothetical protein